MTRKCLSLLILVVAVFAGQVAAQSLVPIDPGSVSDGHVYLFENAGGGTLPDDSANSLDGTAVGAPQTAAGLSGEALLFNGSSDGFNIPDSQYINITGGPFATRTAIAVFNCEDVTTSTKQVIFEEGGNTRGSCFYVHEGLVYAAAWNRAEYNWNGEWLSAPIGSNEWHVVTMVIRDGGEAVTDDIFEMWLDGALVAKAPGGHIHNHSDNNAIGWCQQNTVFHDGNAGADGHYFQGLIDEVWILNQALSEDMLRSIGLAKTTASAPSPASGVTDLPYYSDSLSWTAGDFAAKHNVYLGTDFNDVNEASVSDPRGVLVGEGLIDTAIVIPDPLALETTYYWRVDEVNSPPNSTVFKGSVWDFTVEPVAYEVMNVTATASSLHDPTMGPENTVNGSGLDAAGQHSGRMEDMWLNSMAEPEGAYIQYDLGQVYEIDRAHVWNHNSQTESILGYGIKEALIETSVDGETWTELKTVTLAQATGSDTYTGADVALDQVTARHIRITALSNYSILGLKQVGLAEIRFYYIPVESREFSPTRGTDTSGLDVNLSWRSGRYTTEHRVLVSTDRGSVEDGSAVIATTSDRRVDLSGLEYGQLNYWQVIDVTADGIEYPSDIMYFYTVQNGMIDDMESYQAKEGLFIWEHWVDGFDDPGENGSVVGNGDDPETVEVYEGSQSMPMEYHNTTAPKSEATRSFDPPQDLAAGNPESIEVYVKGIPYEFNGYYSVDGSSWTSMSLNPRYAVMSEDALVGMAVTSHDAALETTGVYSNVATTGNVTGSWTQTDIGGTHPAGNFTEANGTFTIKASGADIWGTADEFRYVHKNLDGEGSISAKVESLDPVHASTKVGVMIRDAAVPEASFTAVYATGTNGVRYETRLETAVSATGDGSVLDGSQELMTPPVWVRIERKLANDAAPIYMTLTDSAGKSATIETEDVSATRVSEWTLLSAAPADLNVNLSQIESITIGVGGAGVEGKIFVDAINVNRPPALPPLEEVSPEALIAQYEFEDGGADSTGNNPGELFGNATITPDGKSGLGLNLMVAPDANGTDVGSWVAIDNLSYNATGIPAVSVTAWMRTGLETNQIIASFDRNEYWRLEINGDGAGPGQVGWDVMTDAGQLDYGSLTRVDDGEWHHLAGVFDKGTARLFIDGLPEPAATLGSTMGSGNLRYGFLGVGSEADMYNGLQNGTPNYFVGDVDDVRIYHRALSPGEAASLASE